MFSYDTRVRVGVAYAHPSQWHNVARVALRPSPARVARVARAHYRARPAARVTLVSGSSGMIAGDEPARAKRPAPAGDRPLSSLYYGRLNTRHTVFSSSLSRNWIDLTQSWLATLRADSSDSRITSVRTTKSPLLPGSRMTVHRLPVR